ncbi:alpha-1,2-mannosyltransferase ALG9-like isoform X1 [Gigantopelta aegis]|uniref:alpha-1,2-mannosyltransferase ALG9-like isoform X1 n=1 Tax=Gigantopelta aegis TaxID=1735272 RepID=UPI001B88B737|nr:alpha-1,2-mannosyltransferase ALG9-like isoform X1 [Gigantopelta aegis]
MSASMKRRQHSKSKKDEENKIESPGVQEFSEPYTIPNYTAFKILMSARLCAAWWNIITDCDEVYNYWEPMHFMLFGNGFQTWEYSPMYAIRSYFYLWIHSLPINLYKTLLNDNQIILFYLMRCILGFASAVCEAYFYKGICRQFGNNVGRLTICFLLFSTGMFISCTAFLPSSFSMYMTMLAMGAWYLGQNHYAIVAIAASTIIGWPFAAALGIPIAFDIVVRQRQFKFFLMWCAIGLAAFLIPSVKKDSDLYGGLVIAPLNIILYNVFSEHGPDLYGTEPVSFYLVNGFVCFTGTEPVSFYLVNGFICFTGTEPVSFYLVNGFVCFTGTEPVSFYLVNGFVCFTGTEPVSFYLVNGFVCFTGTEPVSFYLVNGFVCFTGTEPVSFYLVNGFVCFTGTEPVSFYLVNGFLNFNFIFVAALVSLPFALFVAWYLGLSQLNIPLWLAVSPMYIWILIFFSRPHKEERFLFPIYPCFAMCGAVCFDYFQKLIGSLMPKKPRLHYTVHTNWMAVLSSIVFALLSLSRIVAIYQGYHASMDIYVEMNKISSDSKIHTLSPDKQVNVCVGKEWYRYPSSFFMPSENWHLQFVQSEFKGLLPKPYEMGPRATQIFPSHMNDMNREEPSRYINITKCHYLIDLDLETETKLEPRYSHSESWKVLASVKFLDARRSHRFFRAFYVPFLSSKYCTYVDYNLLKTTRTRKYKTRSR